MVALVSGGKDSCFAMMRCMDYGHKARLHPFTPHTIRPSPTAGTVLNSAVACRLSPWLILSPSTTPSMSSTATCTKLYAPSLTCSRWHLAIAL